MRADPQNLPAGLTKPWPGAGYAGFGGGDHGTRLRRARARSTTSSRAKASPASRRSRAIATASGPASRRKRCRRANSSRSASHSSPARSRRRAWSSRSSTSFRKTIRCARCSSPIAGAATPSQRSTCCCATACAAASNTRTAATSRRRGRCRIPTTRRISRSSTWAGTAMRSCARARTAFETEFVCIPRPDRAQRGGGWRRPALSRRPSRSAVEGRRSADVDAARARGRSQALDLDRLLAALARGNGADDAPYGLKWVRAMVQDAVKQGFPQEANPAGSARQSTTDEG